ncbi:hypothetical protein HRED_08341 [Candidatus Haloredivivus sp. G17]|nr:hypothetical protein HRED_08341 [Candidatus Haloredivivus sp. G17]
MFLDEADQIKDEKVLYDLSRFQLRMKKLLEESL